MDIFRRYAPFIQEFIYRNRWEDLRAVQVAAGEAIFTTDQNVLLCASTASGKTEAAFFPILTEFTENPPASVGCLYIAPLKALINDQFLRLNDLCREGEIPVWHWHGDVSSSHKKKLLKHPSGILQITPESLEALLLRRHGEIGVLFGDLRYVVIDEVHSLLRGDRGGQCLCQIQRLSRLAGVNPRRIGLSATIGEPEEAGRFLSEGTGRGTVIPDIPSTGMRWRLSMEHFYQTPPQAAEASGRILNIPGQSPEDPGRVITPRRGISTSREDADETVYYSADADETVYYPPDADEMGISLTGQEEGGAEPTDTAPVAADPGIGYIFEHTRGMKCLVFSNSREECEEVTSTLRAYCEANHEPERFLIHHGNLSTSFREDAEDAMRDEDSALTTCTTATLELGIDIGKLERAFQIDAPFTVSAFLQRMGRTGRRGAPCEMWFVMREEHEEPRDLLPDKVPWKLLQGIALVQLYLEERWVEPPRKGRLPFSLLFHQTMSILTACGEMTPAELASRTLTLAPFANISTDDFRMLLNSLLEQEMIERTENGGLIVAPAGERITNSFKFYAVFQENEEYSVRCESQELGTIVKPPPVGDRIAIAGRVWVVEEVDRQRHQVYVHMIKGRVPAYFGEEPGDIHTRILERMRRVLREEQSYPYLLENARARLLGARLDARNSGIADNALVCMGGRMYCLTPWLGSYAFLALERFLRLRCAKRLGLKGFNSVRPYFCQFTLGVSEEEFYAILKDEAEKPIDPMELLYPDEVPLFDKYDDILPAELVRRGFAYGVLDIEGMKKRIFEWSANR